jgi:hypothetical protein
MPAQPAAAAVGPPKNRNTRNLIPLAFVVHCLSLSVVCYQCPANGSVAFADNGELGMGWMTEETG